MKRSTDRILTTHVGSLARPNDLLEVMREKESGRPYDREAFEARVRSAVGEVVRRQADCGIDVVADGEQGKVSFLAYVHERLDGFEPEPGPSRMPPSWVREVSACPEYYEDYFKKYSSTVAPLVRTVCRGPVGYKGQAAVQADIENLKAALDGLEVEEAFMPAIAPYGFAKNEYYPTDEEDVHAVGEALREEYRAIVHAFV